MSPFLKTRDDSVVADLRLYQLFEHDFSHTTVFFPGIYLRTYLLVRVSEASYLLINAAKQTADPDNNSLRYTQHVIHFFKASICRNYKLITDHLGGVFLCFNVQ